MSALLSPDQLEARLRELEAKLEQLESEVRCRCSMEDTCGDPSLQAMMWKAKSG